MSHRGGYPRDPWGRPGPDGDPNIPASYKEPKGFFRSPAPADYFTFLPPGAGTSHSESTDLDSQITPRPFNHYPGGYPSPFGPPSVPSGTGHATQELPNSYGALDRGSRQPFDTVIPDVGPWPAMKMVDYGPIGRASVSVALHDQSQYEAKMKASPDDYQWEQESSTSRTSSDYAAENPPPRGISGRSGTSRKTHAQRKPSNRDEFDGPHQYLDRPSPHTFAAQERDLPHLPTNLEVQEVDDVLSQVNDRLSKCAFDFVAKYQFPIPLEPDKRPVRVPADREWTEWVYLLKRLATKRRIPARVLYGGQIKQLVTVLENSLEMRHAAKHQSRPLKDDRNVLQLISAGLQVAKILKDGGAMEMLDSLYIDIERLIQSRRSIPAYLS
ncbi:hypothetical protein LPUS_05703 [Lasallia pustulata]|uniref:Uncharacterized protein n=1 Tax=Lasallia pustulata TaxID=136370 RepID=A0A1W5CZA2_9LECA|nr:hypothetical protein LPUS_05703 [Lasallia pustulata]